VAYGDDGATCTVAVSNSGGAVTSTSATLHLALSADQQAFEALILGANAGSYEFAWNLNPDPTSTQVANTDWLQSDYSQLNQSPLTQGPQLVTQSGAMAATATLPVVAQAPSRELVNGAILVVPTSGAKYSVSYKNSTVQVDFLAQDGATVAYSQLRSGFAVHAWPVNSDHPLAGRSDVEDRKPARRRNGVASRRRQVKPRHERRRLVPQHPIPQRNAHQPVN